MDLIAARVAHLMGGGVGEGEEAATAACGATPGGGDETGEGGVGVVVTRERHRRLLVDCVAALDRFQERFDQAGTGGDVCVELCAEELREAMALLGQVTGTVTTDDLLDVIFKEFCIGK